MSEALNNSDRGPKPQALARDNFSHLTRMLVEFYGFSIDTIYEIDFYLFLVKVWEDYFPVTNFKKMPTTFFDTRNFF